jgi:ankyrin repeat protein
MPSTADLYNAIAADDLTAVERLLADPEGLTLTHAYDRSTPLLQATKLGYVGIVRCLLVGDRFFIDEGDDQTCFTPLMAACENGSVEIVRLLLAAGAKVNAQYEREFESDETFAVCQEVGYPLTLAVDNGEKEIAALLLEHGADPGAVRCFYNGWDNFNETPLLLAVQANRLDLAELLLQHGARVDGECLVAGEPHTPLSYAIECSKAEWTQFLLRHGADADMQVDGESVREYAERLGREELLHDGK